MTLFKKNIILFILVIALLIIPLALLKEAEFAGTDSLAEETIIEINPNYEPWFSYLYEPASDEIATLLFALQAAIGAGVVGFVLGRITSNKITDNKTE